MMPWALMEIRTSSHQQGKKLELKVRLLEWNACTENPLDPALVWHLGRNYDKWQGATGGNEARHLPYWTDEKYLDWVYKQ